MHNLNPQKLKVVVFDWDGTLAESRTPRLYSINKVMAEYGLPDWESTLNRQNQNLSFMDNFPLVFGSRAAEIYAKYSEVYKKYVGQMIYAFQGVNETLELLRQNNVLMAIMTNKDRRLLEFELPLLFEPSLFAKIVCGHEAAHDKPYAEHALCALNGLIKQQDINADTVWIVGDSVLDNMTAAAVGAKPIRICNGKCEYEKIEGAEVWYFNHFKDFYQQLNCELTGKHGNETD